ncbi:hypothetical protein MMC31_007255 [Peltigera leucophlebia]|nr:hypothetical protein [Peltigera leucophlebia]
METPAAYFPLDYRAPSTPSFSPLTSRSSRSSIACRLEERQDTTMDQKLKDTVTVAAGSIPPTLPPSVEEAYKKKCIELKRRMNEVEESNDAFRLRKIRLMRGIRKMRLERAFLLDILGKRMRKNGAGTNGLHGMYDEESEGSSDGPPTPLEKPLRSKRSHRRAPPTPPPGLAHLVHNVPSSGQPTSSFPDFQPTNGTLTMRLNTNSGPMSFAPISNHNNAHELELSNHHISPGNSRLQMPPAPFDDFYEVNFLSMRHRWPDDNDAQLTNRARREWANMGDADTEVYRARHEGRYQAFQTAMDERGPREREMERDRDVEGDTRSRGGGGFTAVNG